MTNEEFKFWIKGFIVLSKDTHINSQQIHIIKNHANLVSVITGKLDESIIRFIACLDKINSQSEDLSRDAFIQISIQCELSDSNGISSS